jgi:uncharacterized protein
MRFFIFYLTFGGLLGLASLSVIAQNIPVRPQPAKYVNDYAGMMSPTDAQVLENKLEKYHDSTSTQIVIVTLQSLNGKNIDEFANQWARTWGIGQKGVNNGILIMASKQDRKIRIEVGYGLESTVPDLATKEIRERYIVPNFKAGNFYLGFDKAVEDIIRRIGGEYKDEAEKLLEQEARNNPNAQSEDERSFWIFRILAGAVLIGVCFIDLSKTPLYSLLIAIFLLMFEPSFIIEAIIAYLLYTPKKSGKTYANKRRNNSSSSSYNDSSSSTTFITTSYSDYSDYSDKSTYSDYSDTSSYSDSSSSYSDSSFGGGDFGGGGSSGDW